MIQLHNVSKKYSLTAAPAVDAISFEVGSGELVALVGESGCGKTTTLKMINRLTELSSGTITIDGEDIMNADPVSLRRRIGYVFQEIGLFPHLTITENIGLVPKLLGWPKARIKLRSEELLQLTGLDPGEFSDRLPADLSGGQRQRVGVARALAAEPRLMLMDEPFGALDPITRTDLQEEFKQLQEKLHLTVVLVTHDMMEALILADRIFVMEGGKIIARGSPQELLTGSVHPYARKLLETPRRQAKQLADIVPPESLK